MSIEMDIDRAMRALSELSGNAKRLGFDSVHYAANRAWWELYKISPDDLRDSPKEKT